MDSLKNLGIKNGTTGFYVTFIIPILLGIIFGLSVPFTLPWDYVVYGTTGSIGLYVLYYLYDYFFVPLHYLRTVGTVKSNGPEPNFLNQSRRLGNFPPPYPNGWYALCQSSELKKGGVMPMNVLGGQYVLWRDYDGVAHLFDTYCPHLGTNLAFGGEVSGNCLKCPFHQWEYDGNGACAKTPYSDEPVKFAKIQAYVTLEQNKLVLFWYDVEGREPYWFPPTFQEIESGEFTYHGKTEHHVLAHIQELPENGADVSHLSTLHKSVKFGLSHVWRATWEPLGQKQSSLPPDPLFQHEYFKKNSPADKSKLKHWTEIKILEIVSLFGIPLKFINVKVIVHQIGPGIVWLRFSTIFGEALMCGAVTPFAPMVQRTYHLIYSSRSIPRFMAKSMVSMVGQFYEQDMQIWQWKTFPSKPMLAKEDSNIRQYRKWFSQFYSEKSVTFDDAVNTFSKGRAAVPMVMDW